LKAILAQAVPKDHHMKRILLVEDQADIREAASGDMGLQSARQLKPDLLQDVVTRQIG
jgi:hypothetical protein